MPSAVRHEARRKRRPYNKTNGYTSQFSRLRLDLYFLPIQWCRQTKNWISFSPSESNFALHPVRSTHTRSTQKMAEAKLDFDAAIFDMDGVLTQTAAVHSTAWKRMFDEYLRGRESKYGEPFNEFTHTGDYLAYVDGRPRNQGVATFLQSRGILLPFGLPEDSAGTESVCGLGNRKNALFNQIIESEGVRLYDSTVLLIQDLLRQGIKVGLATSSKNSAIILQKTDTAHLFATVVDGLVSEKLGLKGKPEPDIFTTASANLGVPSARAIVVEDAVSGVQAGAKGGFALVIGVAREDNTEELRHHGANLVVSGIFQETSVEPITFTSCGPSALAPEAQILNSPPHVPLRKKPLLSFWQLWNMSFGYVGIQFGFALQKFKPKPDFRNPGREAGRHSRLLWIAAPLSGLIVQPIIRLHERPDLEPPRSPEALFSDGSNSGVGAGIVGSAQFAHLVGGRRHVMDARCVDQHHHGAHACLCRRYVVGRATHPGFCRADVLHRRGFDCRVAVAVDPDQPASRFEHGRGGLDSPLRALGLLRRRHYLHFHRAVDDFFHEGIFTGRVRGLQCA